MNKIYVVRIPQETPKVDTLIFSSYDREECIDFFKKSDYTECYLEEWCGTVVRVRNYLIK